MAIKATYDTFFLTFSSIFEMPNKLYSYKIKLKLKCL